MVSHFLAPLGVSTEVGVVEVQIIGDFNVARPGPAAADVLGTIVGLRFDVTNLIASFET